MLKRVSIQNFKSLKDVTLDLQKVNLLIGPNNSGKTNFLKALEFIGNWNEGKFSQESNFQSLLFKRAVEIQGFKIELVTFEIDIKGEFHYSLQLTTSHIAGEANEYNESLWDINKMDDRSDLTYHPYYGITLTGERLGSGPIELGNFLRVHANAYTPGARIIKKSLDKLKIYKPDPNKLIQPGPVGTGEDLVNADASNLVSFLDLMLGKYRKVVFNRTEIDLHTCIPEFDEINLDDALPTEELKKQFGDKSFKRLGLTNSEQGTTYWADELSEGTLYFLALLCIINQPNPPKLLLLEEPEKGIHPRRIREVMDFIFRLAEEKDVQVIMTTHSPIVVDLFKDIPESVFIFDKDEEGATHVKNLQKDIIEPETEESKRLNIEPPHYTSSLGDAWTVGFLGGVPK